MLEIELSQREFVPIIRRILNNPPDTEPTEWKVETDRGVTVFQLESENDIHRNEAGQVTLVDAHGIRYLIPIRVNSMPQPTRARPVHVASPRRRRPGSLPFLEGAYLIRRASMVATSRLANSSVKNQS